MGKVGHLHSLWRAQGLLHNSDSVVLPAALLITAVGMAMYQHMTDKYDTTIRNFLVMVLLSMVPLAFLEKKLLACVDPVGILSKFSTKVMMMHACFLTTRMLYTFFFDFEMNIFASRNLFFLVTTLFLLPVVFGFRLSLKCFWEHRDVWCLVMAAVLTAVFTELIDAYTKGQFNFETTNWINPWYRRRLAMMISLEASDYIEILAFVPAMWMVCRKGKDATAEEVDVADTQKRVLGLFAFMIAFYLTEDVHGAYVLCRDSPIAAAGHIAHYLLLLDFAAFILAHLYDPEKYERLMAKFWNLMSDRSMV